MKKSYTKPDIIFESFSLSTDIAGGCGVITDTPVDGLCGYDMGMGLKIFLSDVKECDVPVEDGSSQYNGICYDVPIDSKELFNS